MGWVRGKGVGIEWGSAGGLEVAAPRLRPCERACLGRGPAQDVSQIQLHKRQKIDEIICLLLLMWPHQTIIHLKNSLKIHDNFSTLNTEW